MEGLHVDSNRGHSKGMQGVQGSVRSPLCMFWVDAKVIDSCVWYFPLFLFFFLKYQSPTHLKTKLVWSLNTYYAVKLDATPPTTTTNTLILCLSLSLLKSYFFNFFYSSEQKKKKQYLPHLPYWQGDVKNFVEANLTENPQKTTKL